MKNRLIITVSDVNGTKSYNIHQLVRKFLVVIIVFVFLVLAGSFWFISYLNKEIKEVKKDKQEIINNLEKKEKELLAQNSFYSAKIKSKVKDLDELSSKLDHIEEIIGLKNNDNKDLITRTTLATISSVQKMYMLTTLPNGSPLKNTRVTSWYGYRIHPITKKKKFHRGIDLKASRRTEVFATADGIVSYVQSRDIGGFGRVIKIIHGYGFQTVYAHLNKTKVKIGDVIKKGQLIGLSGNSGRSSGPHLHYEVRYGNKVLNPRAFLNWDLNNYETIFKKQRRVPWESLVNLINEHNKMVRQ